LLVKKLKTAATNNTAKPLAAAAESIMSLSSLQIIESSSTKQISDESTKQISEEEEEQTSSESSSTTTLNAIIVDVNQQKIQKNNNDVSPAAEDNTLALNKENNDDDDDDENENDDDDDDANFDTSFQNNDDDEIISNPAPDVILSSNNNVIVHNSQPNKELTEYSNNSSKKRKRTNLVVFKKVNTSTTDGNENNYDSDDKKDIDFEMNEDDEEDEEDEDDDHHNKNLKKKKMEITIIQHSSILKKSENKIDEHVRNKLVRNLTKSIEFTIVYTIYVYHKIVTALMYSLVDNYCKISSRESLWNEIIADVLQNLNDLSIPKLNERVSRKAVKTVEEKIIDKTIARQRKTLCQRIRLTNKKAVVSSVKQIIFDYKKLFDDEYILEREQLFRCLFQKNSFHFNNYNYDGGSMLKEMEPLYKISSELVSAVIKFDMDNDGCCNAIITKQIAYIINSNSDNNIKKKKSLVVSSDDISNHLPPPSSQALINNNVINNSTNQIPLSSRPTPTPPTPSEAALVKNNVISNNNSNSSLNKIGNEIPPLTQPSTSTMGNKISLSSNPFLNPNNSSSSSSLPHHNNLNAFTPILFSSPLDTSFQNNISRHHSAEMNIVTNDKMRNSLSSSLINNRTKNFDEENDVFKEMLEVIFGSEQVIIGSSNRMKICLNRPNFSNETIFRKQFEIIFQIFSDVQYSHKTIYNINEEVDRALIKQITNALNPITVHLFTKIQNVVVPAEEKKNDEYNPFSLFEELNNANKSDTTIAQTIEGFLEIYENNNTANDELMVDNAIKLFQIVNLYLNNNHHHNEEKKFFPLVLQGNPSCFSILPYLLFQECNANIDENIIQTNYNNDENVWAILSMYRTVLESNYIPGFFSPSFEELNQLLRSEEKKKSVIYENQYFVFQKNGNFKFHDQNRMSESFEKCVDDFVKSLLNSIYKNIKGKNYGFLKKDHLINAILKNCDVHDLTDNMDDRNAKSKLQLCPKSISRYVNLSLSSTFKLKNNLFCCFNFIDLEENLISRRNNFFFQTLLKFTIKKPLDFYGYNNYRNLLCGINYEPLLIELYHGKNVNSMGSFDRLFNLNEWLSMDCVNFVININLLDKKNKELFEHFTFLNEEKLKNYDEINDAHWFDNHHTSCLKNRFKKEWKGYFKKQLWIIPMFRNGNHFSLFLVVNPNLIAESKCKILLLDSLNHARENLSREELKDELRIRLLITEWYNFVNDNVLEHVQIFDSITTLKLTKIPQQSDGSSCGWYCILFAKFAVGT
jgi:hypothetical protein